MQVWAEFSSHLHDLTSRGHQRVAFWGLRNNESFCEAIVSIDSKVVVVVFKASLH